MADDTVVIERLQRYAKAIARKFLQEFDLAHDDAWHEAKAKFRMSSRSKNEAKKLFTALKQPRGD